VYVLSNWKDVSQLGDAIGQEAYRRGIEPADVDWSTIERVAEEKGVDLDYSRVTRELVADHINSSWDSAAYYDEQRAKPWWARGW
jgi:hypothetical protein